MLTLTLRHTWLIVLVLSLAGLVIETGGVAFGVWEWWPSQAHSALIAAAATSSIMCTLVRQIGPVQEAYRLGMVAGARQERERADLDHREQGGRRGRRLAVGSEGEGAARPPLTLIHKR